MPVATSKGCGPGIAFETGELRFATGLFAGLLAVIGTEADSLLARISHPDRLVASPTGRVYKHILTERVTFLAATYPKAGSLWYF